jgi:uncharacterized membrane protein YbhN (UPF0104 family)
MEYVDSSPARSRGVLRLVARLGITACVLAFLFLRADATRVLESTRRVPPGALLLAFLTFTVGMSFGLWRWRLLFAAYGAQPLPSPSELTRWYLISMFYNLLPGAVGGDVLRGYATRRYFPEGGSVRSISVVLVERLLGLAGLLLGLAVAGLFSALVPQRVMQYSIIGSCVSVVMLMALARARELQRFVPRRIAGLFEALPARVGVAPLAAAVLISVVPHVLAAISGHLLIASVAPAVPWADSMVIFSLGTLAAFFPFTVAGAGARDAALVVLLARAGVAQADALACSLVLLAFHLLLALIGGALRVPHEEAVKQAAAAPLPLASSSEQAS